MKSVFFIVAFSHVVSAVFKPGPGAADGSGRPPPTYKSPLTTQFFNGNLGALDSNALQHLGESDIIVKNAAEETLKSVLAAFMSATGDEVVQATSHEIPVDSDGNFHVRFRQFIEGYPVEGATMMMHVSGKDGTVYAFNGEFSPSHALDLKVDLECNEAVEMALAQSGIENGAWLTECEKAAVRGFYDGLGHLAFKRLVGYQPEDSKPYQRTIVFASASTGKLLALHPQTRGEKSIETWDCKRTSEYCRMKSNSSYPMTSGNPAVVAAHNYAIVTYDFYKSEYGRDSVDNNGTLLKSFANYGTENNAWWNSEDLTVTYGGGDGVEYYPFSLALDVVAHEITHGVTQFSSNLIYWGESGAMNEAMSDIFGAVVERLHLHKSVNETWLEGEDVFISGGAFRNMQDPAAFDCVDYYPDIDDYYYYYYYRNCYSADHCSGDVNGDGNEGLGMHMYEVHNFSGIGNLAFALVVQGGTHPRNKTNVVVPAINSADFDASLKAAASIFYLANTQCLTESSTYNSFRFCTLMYAGEYASSVSAAWKAVGIVSAFDTITELVNGSALTGQHGNWNEVRVYYLKGVMAGETVTCATSANNGDADLFLRLGNPAQPSLQSYLNDCGSGTDGSYEACTTKVSLVDTTAFVTVLAYEGYTDLSVTCFRTANVGYLSVGSPVTMQNGTAGVVQYYEMDWADYEWGVDEGDQFKCVTFGTNGDADLFFKFGSLPSPFSDVRNDCESISKGSSKESCTATYMFNGIVSHNAFAAVYSSTGYKSLTVQCAKFSPPRNITAGEAEYVDLYPGLFERFKLHGVKAHEAVSCAVQYDTDYYYYSDDDSDDYDADADLYVRLGQEAVPYEWSNANDCWSVGQAPSKDHCTTPLATLAMSAYVTIAPTIMDYCWYCYASLTCTICKSKGAACNSRSECSCFNPTDLCDNHICKACIKTNQKCTRNSQCCSGMCQNKKCKKKRK